jgi:CheY-like chemotaxis protein
MPATSEVRRVLVVEDDEPSCHALREILEGEGFQVDTARDGAEGVRRVREFEPHVVVMDLVLPELNGFDAARVLKSDASTAEIPLFAVTASWLGSDGERLRVLGFAGALRKPFPPHALLGELRRLLEEDGARGGPT